LTVVKHYFTVVARGIEMAKKKDERKVGRSNAWGHVRARLVRRGDAIVLDEPSNNTASDQRADYEALVRAVRQLGQYVSQRGGSKPSPDEIREAFRDVPILVGDANEPGYATDADLMNFVNYQAGQSASAFAKSLMAQRWGQSVNTIETYIKPHRNRGKKI
jgi:hypothetical protein